MWRQFSWFGGVLFLAATVVLVTPAFGQAQHRGGGFGGVHVGGYRGGVSHYGYGTSFPRYGSGTSFPRYGNGSSFSRYGYGTSFPRYGYGTSFPLYGYGYSRFYRPYNFYGYPYYYGSYNNSPYDYSYNYSFPAYGDGSASPAYRSGYYGPNVVVPSSYSAPPQPNAPAHVTVRAPANAEIWVDGLITASSGPVREFDSTPLVPGYRYTYEIMARWNQNGEVVNQTQQVEVRAGAQVTVRFPT
jgi:uncharacterized protein (TIGR03000 family)